MGGHALKHLAPQRVTSAQAINVFNHLQRSAAVTGLVLHLVPWIEEKRDHGDIDILTSAPVSYVRAFIRETLGAIVESISVTNGTVISVPFTVTDGFLCQVDFICDATTSFYRFYYSGGDFGLLMGRVASWHGLVFAMDGLRLRHNPAYPWSEDITLTDSPEKALMALRYRTVLPQWKTYEDMWQFILSSPMAKPWMFLPESTDAENRSRDRQRAMMPRFASWLGLTYGENFLHQKEGFYERRTFEQAIDYLTKMGFEAWGDLPNRIEEQRRIWEDKRAEVRSIGLGAVEHVADEPLTQEQMGEIVHEMQAYLPPKEQREIYLRAVGGQYLMVRLARSVARFLCIKHGYSVKPVENIGS
jgi:hypothetical protein